ncbi:hypothetical protein ACFX5U_06680 [Sphingobacterium sp. SG20118]|uniref:hypothetical protein n=1 Tax=Sphingobacterium TaxID=28453 RepID=UPI0024696449|nr:hypothetical protein [Sphingobacterium faecium]MDH5827174.1 hypothetical protein [Sphingobacterium faecium]
MKKLVYLTVLVGGLFFVKPAEAQVNVSINIGNQPTWGPVGYDYARYYYIPEINVYYDVVNRRYTHYQGRRWITSRNLPGRYRNFNFYNTYKVVVNDRDPWRHHDRYRREYGHYAHRRNQVNLRDHRGHDHPRNNNRYDDHRIEKRNDHRRGRSENRKSEKRNGKKDHDRRSDRGEGHGRR